MIGNTKIFISSTCFDLDQVRENLKITLEDVGHLPVLSEYPNFPVNPAKSAIQNCKENVKKNCDLFVLIVGNESGSIDKDSGKSIVNLEFDVAQRKNIDTFIFIKKSIFELIPLWKDNPNADFSKIVNSTQVIEFVDKLKNYQWVFTYNRASDIENILKNQLSVYLKNLIEEKKKGTLTPLPEFINELEKVREIALNKYDFWEYHLTIELLKDRYRKIESKYEDVQTGYITSDSIIKKDLQECLDWVKAINNDYLNLVNVLKISVEQKLREAWGEPGKPGDPIMIKNVVDHIYETCNKLVSLELKTKKAIVPEEYEQLFEIFEGWAPHLFENIGTLIEGLEQPFKGGEPSGEYFINLVIDSPPNIKRVGKILRKIEMEMTN